MFARFGSKSHLVYTRCFSNIFIIQMPEHPCRRVSVCQFENRFSLRTVQLPGNFDDGAGIRVDKLHRLSRRAVAAFGRKRRQRPVGRVLLLVIPLPRRRQHKPRNRANSPARGTMFIHPVTLVVRHMYRLMITANTTLHRFKRNQYSICR